MRSRLIVIVTAFLLAACGREYVRPEQLGPEIARHELLAAHMAAVGTFTERQRAEVGRDTVIAARRALEAGNVSRAQIELDVARDLLRTRP